VGFLFLISKFSVQRPEAVRAPQSHRLFDAHGSSLTCGLTVRTDRLPGGMLPTQRDSLGAVEPQIILVAAFDKAWETVQASGVVYAEAKAEAVRAILAKHIIEAAKQGERDHTRLRDGALLALAQSNLRNSPPPPPR
jgi:hypothetical protein